LIENVIAHSVRTSSPRFIGHMTSALPYFVRPLVELMTAMNQNVVKIETSKTLTYYERQAIAMIHRLIYDFSDDFYYQHIQKNESTLGVIVSGGTIANIMALWCARNSSLGQKSGFTGVEKEGLPAAHDSYGQIGSVIIGSSLMHNSFEKAVDLLGLGTHNLIKVHADHNGRMDLLELQRTLSECRARRQQVLAIVGIAGTTECGTVDPLLEMAEIAAKFNVHFHVDAAWGGPLLFSGRHRHKLIGIEQADSVTIDGHKQLYLPMGIGMVMLRDPQKARVIEKKARYIYRSGSPDLGRRALESSRPAMALLLNAALNIISRRGYEFLIDEGVRKTQYMANSIRVQDEFELLMEPETNILVYRYIPKPWRGQAARKQLDKSDNQQINLFNERLQKVQRQAGHSFVSRTTLENTCYGRRIPIVALRAVIANPITTELDIDAVLNDQLALATSIDVT
jgi:putative pyridoxal-dependent aspartate 1-decarboxylase